MSSNQKAHRNGDEPEPIDLTHLNIEASMMCLASKVGPDDGDNDHDHVHDDKISNVKIEINMMCFVVVVVPYTLILHRWDRYVEKQTARLWALALSDSR